jgi:hypothetical protein
MMMIERISGIEFLKDHKITDLKPQFLMRPILIRDVPSSSTAPPSFWHSCSSVGSYLFLLM